MDGLWLLRSPTIRKLSAFSIFLDCPAPERLRRRIQRDTSVRQRTREAVEIQFRRTVEPMHQRFVAPQQLKADMVMDGNCSGTDVRRLAGVLRMMIESSPREAPSGVTNPFDKSAAGVS
jgi:uridine kinase